ncbi:MAG: hypothetical protein A3D31_14360 [Candidatus Fluviicola riflensis]|nr:MAG: hypothetical protein CHH17_18795 [Candidatus Fluviicola riflensis]OGS78154.1 MAG: hypothetical protein A3D31_14360 [Candidatus Fluviicola riflensis]OGS85220.1 MAG: hypothetical protein A2724_11295 [Fluviicola sp. RIFCSPHIGHO2_01_FULL_43_53]OGS89491.1 MAG: hypothetical protein A3E30_05600 [Fluviicola sp. RIFCSPHIGHO2_12_FULL_43_24]
MNTEIFLEIVLLVVAVYLAFFKSYLTEKGKSAALQEDLSQLTKEVESVKDKFIQEQEILKIELQRILNNEISYRTEERNAIVNFHGTTSEWLYSILEVGFGNYSTANIESLKQTRIEISKFFAKAGIAKSKVELLVEDKELINLSRKLYSEILSFHNWASAKFLQLQHNLENQKDILEEYLILAKATNQTNEYLNKSLEDMKRYKNEESDLFNNYMELRNIEYFKVKPIEDEFLGLVKLYLKK